MTITTMCYPEKNGQYLMLYRNKKKNDPNAGKWIGIGGHLERGETANECIVREVLEETGMRISSPTFRGTVFFYSDKYDDECIFLYTYKLRTDDNIDLDCNEGELAFVDIDKVTELPLWEGDKIFLELLTTEERVFTLSLSYEGDKLVSQRLFFEN